jgi:hypothetical protein
MNENVLIIILLCGFISTFLYFLRSMLRRPGGLCETQTVTPV